MATGKTALKEQALATLQAGRREISAEAQWIRNGLNPKRAVQKLARDHSLAVLLGAVAIGIAVPLLFMRKSKDTAKVTSRRAAEDDDDEELYYQSIEPRPGKKAAVVKVQPARRKVGVMAYLLGLGLKTAMPFLVQSALKFAEQHLASHLGRPPGDGPPEGTEPQPAPHPRA